MKKVIIMELLGVEMRVRRMPKAIECYMCEYVRIDVGMYVYVVLYCMFWLLKKIRMLV